MKKDGWHCSHASPCEQSIWRLPPTYRPTPKRIRSDNGTNFLGVANELSRLPDFFDHEAVRRELTVKGIDWQFNCPANPEAGGAWERLVQSTKRILAVTLKETAPRVETLRSMLLEAANILNSRPLTHVPVDAADADPITPNHFLIGHTGSTTTPGDIDNRQLCSHKQWRVCQQLTNRFWVNWIRDYLPELTRRSKHHGEIRELIVGDLVLICDVNQSRSQWRRGRVTSTTVGTDGRVRMAEVQTSTGLLRRPVTKLAVLDVSLPRDTRHAGPGMSPLG